MTGKSAVPMISVIIPVYNAEGTVLDAVRSVESQGFRDFEIIIVDDCSTDGTLSLLEKECGNHQIVKSNVNKGPASARNAGLAIARGEWIAFLDADDEWVPDRLEAQIKLTEKCSSSDVMFCGEVKSRDDGGSGKAPESVAGYTVRNIVLDEFISGNPVITSTVLVKREVVEAVGGFDETFKGPEDYDLWIRVAAKYGIIKVNKTLSFYRERHGSLSNNYRAFLPQVLRVIDKAFGAGGTLGDYGFMVKRKAQAHQILAASWSAANAGNVAGALRLFGRSLIYWAGPLGRYHPAWGRTRLLVFFARAAMRSKLGK